MGIIQKVNSQGYYQNYNTETGEFIGENLRPYNALQPEVVEMDESLVENSKIAQNVTTADQVNHQLILTEDGRTIDLDQKHFSIVDEDGRIEFDADGEVLMSIAKDQLTYGNFIRTYRESSKQAMLLLLALQSNAAPLKKGGFDIAYMTDILVDHMIVQFSEEANTIWEALSAMQSSRPEDSAFTLTPDDLRPYTNYKSDEALYNAFKKGCEELKKTNLEFDIPDPEHDGHNIMIHWNDGCEWIGNNKKTGEKAHFDIYTNDFYRVLMSSSGIIHGTHWNRRISRSLKGYARALYLFCARNKNYTKYKGAIPGVKELTVAETRYEMKLDSNTESRGIWRRLKEAKEKINTLPDSEFSVEIYRVPEKGKIEGFHFEIKENRFIDVAAKDLPEKEMPVIEDKPDDSGFTFQLKTLFQISGIMFTDDEIERISKAALRSKKDVNYLMQIIPVFNSRLSNTELEPIEDKVGYFCRMIEQGTGTPAVPKDRKKEDNNNFKKFSQRDYDFEELEKKLLNN